MTAELKDPHGDAAQPLGSREDPLGTVNSFWLLSVVKYSLAFSCQVPSVPLGMSHTTMGTGLYPQGTQSAGGEKYEDITVHWFQFPALLRESVGEVCGFDRELLSPRG